MIRILPRSLAGRLIALLLLALVISQAIAFAVFLNERHLALRAAHQEQVLVRTASLVRLLGDTESHLHERIVRTASSRRLRFWVTADSALEDVLPTRLEQRIALRLSELLEVGSDDLRIRILDRADSKPSGWQARWHAHDDDDDDDHDYRPPRHRRKPPNLILSVHTAAGPWLNAATVAPPPPAGWAWPSLVSMAVMAVAITAIVVVMIRRATKPLQRLAEASDDLGRGETAAALPEEGPEEVRRTTRAFNRMSGRLQRFVQDRTTMLAAISHDLRTPITTLRLRAELIDDEETRDKMLETLAEMQQMAEATLAFAREDAAREDTRVVDISALVASLCDDLVDLGQDVAYEETARLPLPCRPVSLKRAIRNLVENAVRYGERARLRLDDRDEALHLTIDDDGPGLQESEMAQVFEPFYRQDRSRSRETGGIGLGLAIARSIVRGHGGEITLENRSDGGLRATVRLPKKGTDTKET